MKIQYLILTILLLSILTGCSSYQKYDSENLYNCKAGKYSPNDAIKEEANRQGWKIDYLEIRNWTNPGGYVHCSAEIILKKPVVVMGSELKVMPIYSDCNMEGMQNRIKNNIDPLLSCE
jgi:hypothetical protein